MKNVFIVMVVLALAGTAGADLIARYDFENDYTDSSINGHDGTAGTKSEIIATSRGYVLSQKNGYPSAGTESMVSLPVATVSGLSQQVTIAFWQYGISQPKAGFSMQAADSNSSTGVRMLNLHGPWVDKNYYWDAGHNDSDRISYAASASEYGDNWNHWAFTKDTTEEVSGESTGTMRIYLNGVEVSVGYGMTILMNSTAVATQMSLGGGRYTDQNYTGLTDVFTIWDEDIGLAGVNAHLDATIPEPATIALLGLGGLALLRKRR